MRASPHVLGLTHLRRHGHAEKTDRPDAALRWWLVGVARSVWWLLFGLALLALFLIGMGIFGT
jgi:hypothetical protein